MKQNTEKTKPRGLPKGWKITAIEASFGGFHKKRMITFKKGVTLQKAVKEISDLVRIG